MIPGHPPVLLHSGHHHAHAEAHAGGGTTHTHTHVHSQSHSHGESHSHSHSHSHGPADAAGVAGATHLHIDPFSGIAGDMFLGALVDLGVDPEAVAKALREAGLKQGFKIRVARVQRHGIGACDLKVEDTEAAGSDKQEAAEVHQHDHENHHHHHHHGEHGTRRRLLDLAAALPLSDRGRQRAETAINALAEAEARVHGTTPDQVHFHEVGALDSTVDLLGSVMALDLLGVWTVTCGPLPLSSGFVRCAHGLMPVPAPATAYLMEGMPTVGVARRGELVTPTGAALLRGVVDGWSPPPPMTLTGTGYGAGDREDPEVPNLLRLMLGRRD